MCGSGSVFGIRIQEAPEYGKIRIRIHNTVKKLLFFPKPIISPCLSSLCRWWSEDSAACPSACRRDCCRASHWPAVVSIWTSSGPAPPCSSLNMHNSGSYRAPNNHNNKNNHFRHHNLASSPIVNRNRCWSGSFSCKLDPQIKNSADPHAGGSFSYIENIKWECQGSKCR